MLHTPRSSRGMVVTPHHLASQTGLAVLRDGGNAVEAAVAAAATLCVVYPHMTGLGGDGFWLISKPGADAPVALDACGRAAGLATPEFYRQAGHEAIPWRGPLAALTVAGAVSGWMAALEAAQGLGDKPLPLARLFEEAIHYAEHGAPVTAHQHGLTAAKQADLAAQPGFADSFLPGGAPVAEGRLQKRPALAQAFRRLAQAGLDDFYRGRLAADLAADLQRAGSPLRAADLAAQRAVQVAPLRLALDGVELFNLPAPTQGMASLLILGLFERLGVKHGESYEHLHGLIESTKLAFAVRDAILGDPQHMTENPQDYLTPGYIKQSAARIALGRAMDWACPAPDAGDTVWFAAVDRNGLAVSVIQSIFFEFGSGVVLPETGVTWQNRGIAFNLAGRGPRLLRPGAAPYHTLNPALARFSDGRTMAYGTMGGEGQPQTQAAIFSRYAWFGQSPQAAVTAPRWVQGRTWGGDTVTLKVENRVDPHVVAALQNAGHTVELTGGFDSLMGHAGMIVLRPDGVAEGATDPRSDGCVACW